jgi:enterochelin esterase family protein
MSLQVPDRSTLENALALGTPLIENESTVIFAYRGEAERVGVIGDMTQWIERIDLEPLPDSSLFFARVALPADARIEYLLAVDDRPPAPDPLCRYRVLNGLGAHSELAMPSYTHRPIFESIRNGAPGGFDRVARREVESSALEYVKEVHVYLPPGYEADDRARPAVYILDGSDYIEFAHTPAVLDDLILARRIEPLVGIFVSPPNRHLPEVPNRVTEYGLNPAYARFMAEELVPWVDRTFRTRPEATSRMIAGDSYAGVCSLFTSYRYPSVFACSYSQSGYVTLDDGLILRAFAEGDRRDIRLYVDVGIYETHVGSGWLPASEINFTEGNRVFAAVLRDRAYDHVFAEYPEGHTWGNWRAHLIDALVHFFPPR